jgi:hypothetical protein
MASHGKKTGDVVLVDCCECTVPSDSAREAHQGCTGNVSRKTSDVVPGGLVVQGLAVRTWLDMGVCCERSKSRRGGGRSGLNAQLTMVICYVALKSCVTFTAQDHNCLREN